MKLNFWHNSNGSSHQAVKVQHKLIIKTVVSYLSSTEGVEYEYQHAL